MATNSNLALPSRTTSRSPSPSDRSFVKDEVDLTKEIDIEDRKEDTKNALELVQSSEYPTGFKLASIVVALCLAMFLVALDMVRPSPPLNNTS